MDLTPSIVAAGTGASLARATIFAPFMQAACEHFQITEPLDVAAFLAQTGHESGGMVWLAEIWGPTSAQKLYEPQSQKATELGNTQPGDGERFKGRGLIQVTGRHNYLLCGMGLNLDLIAQPELLEQPANAAMSAGWFWFNNKLSAIANAGKQRQLCLRINGGLNGFQDRIALYKQACKALNVDPSITG